MSQADLRRWLGYIDSIEKDLADIAAWVGNCRQRLMEVEGSTNEFAEWDIIDEPDLWLEQHLVELERRNNPRLLIANRDFDDCMANETRLQVMNNKEVVVENGVIEGYTDTFIKVQGVLYIRNKFQFLRHM